MAFLQFMNLITFINPEASWYLCFCYVKCKIKIKIGYDLLSGIPECETRTQPFSIGTSQAAVPSVLQQLMTANNTVTAEYGNARQGPNPLLQFANQQGVSNRLHVLKIDAVVATWDVSSINPYHACRRIMIVSTQMDLKLKNSSIFRE